MGSWSSSIQGIELLDRSRELRFRDENAELLLHIFDLGEAATIAELGCGPGALARALGRWLPSARIVGIDRDRRFLHHARRRATETGTENVWFVVGDALCLPLRDSSVDACLSYTVIEHVPNEPFLREQARACRPGGRVIVMLVLPEKSLSSMPDGWPAMSPREKQLWDELTEAFAPMEAALGVGRHWPEPAELPRLFERLGLVDIRVDALALPVAADDARHSATERRQIIEAALRASLERIDMAEQAAALPSRELHELRRLVNERFARRLNAAYRGDHIWDYSVSFTLAVSGRRRREPSRD